MSWIKLVVKKIFFFPLLRAYRRSTCKSLIDADITRWCLENNTHISDFEESLTKLLFNKTFRTLFYFRCPNIPQLIKKIYNPDQTFFISPACEIDGGILFWHPLSTYLYAKHIGKNCTIRQLTTFGNLGKKNPDALPFIGDNVDIGANVTIIGNIRIGNNVKIGAGAVIVKDVPDNCSVAGNPAYIVRLNGVKCNEKL